MASIPHSTVVAIVFVIGVALGYFLPRQVDKDNRSVCNCRAMAQSEPSVAPIINVGPEGQAQEDRPQGGAEI
jgi:hypothetical protein